MAKRPRISPHLRLADPPEASGAGAAAEGESAAAGGASDGQGAPLSAPPRRSAEDLLTILGDAGAEMAHLGWLGWSKGWEVHLRLTRYWLGLDGRR